MRTRLVGAATVAALAAGALATTSVLGSSHREAPRIMLDPAADNTDVYAFVAPDAPRQLTVIANWVPLVSPAGGPYFGKLDPEAHYYVKIDNTGDGVEDISYRWRFKNTFRNPDSFLYAVPPVNSINDPNLNFVQSYDLDYILYRNGKPGSPSARSRTTCRSRPTTPGRRRSRTTPTSPTGAIRNLRKGGKTFVGPVDDPFFIDLGTVFDGINIDKPGRPMIGLGNQGGGKDDISGYNTHAFALQVPLSDVTRDGRDVKRPNDRQLHRRRLGDHRAAVDERQRQRQGEVEAGQPGREPARQRGRGPDRHKDKYNRTPPPETGRTSASTCQPGAREAAQPALQPRHQGERPHGHRPGAADRRPRPHADLAAAPCPPTR